MSKNLKMSKLLWRELYAKYFNKFCEVSKINEEELLEIDAKNSTEIKKTLPSLIKQPSKNLTKKQPPVKPEAPGRDECCGDGCVRCVFNVYYDKLEKYEKDLEEFKKLTY
jgi:hypothetical protein